MLSLQRNQTYQIEANGTSTNTVDFDPALVKRNGASDLKTKKSHLIKDVIKDPDSTKILSV